MIKVVIADDHKIFRQGLLSLLAAEEEIVVAGATGDGREALGLITDLVPHVAVLDISMPSYSGLDIAAEIKKQGLATQVIILTGHMEPLLARSALSFDVTGYLLKDDAFEDLINAIKMVAAGKKFISSSLPEDVILRDGKESALLTKREREVLGLIAKGLTGKKIAAKLFISPKTVDTHRTNIMRKLNAHSVAELVNYAIKLGVN